MRGFCYSYSTPHRNKLRLMLSSCRYRRTTGSRLCNTTNRHDGGSLLRAFSSSTLSLSSSCESYYYSPGCWCVDGGGTTSSVQKSTRLAVRRPKHHDHTLEQWRRMHRLATTTLLSSSSSSSSTRRFTAAAAPTSTSSLPPTPLVRKYPCIRVCYASQSGTAQLFAMQLVESLEEHIHNNNNNTADNKNEGTTTEVQMLQLNELLVKKSSSNEEEKNYSGFLFDSNISTSDNTDGAAAAALYIIIASTTGVGEPPDNGRDLYYCLLGQQQQQPTYDAATKDIVGLPVVDFCVFGLGNRVAHAEHYAVVAKRLHQKMVELKLGNPILPLALGDDGDCIEDDFDKWQEELIRLLFDTSSSTSTSADSNNNDEDAEDSPAEAEATAITDGTTTTSSSAPSQEEEGGTLQVPIVAPCPGSISGTRRISAKYPMLKLAPAASTHVRLNLLEQQQEEEDKSSSSGSSSKQKAVVPAASTAARLWYPPNVRQWSVHQNRNLNCDPAANGMRHLVLQLDDDDDDDTDTTLYQAGDHLFLIPRNADCVVEAYLRLVLDDVSPHAVIQGVSQGGGGDCSGGGGGGSSPIRNAASTSTASSYPYPMGLTVYETLSHCVDLSAIPSPSMVRFLLKNQKKQLDYKEEIAKPRRTALTLLLENRIRVSLEDLLFALAPIRGRFYSIASSPRKDPNKVHLVYRPVRYMSDRGYLREGLCTNYMANLNEQAKVVARININPTFRLPADPKVPIILLSGGCGVAPIRAFLEERNAILMQQQQQQQQQDNSNNRGGAECFFGDALFFVGYRNPADAVWPELIEESLKTGALTEAFVTYTTGVPDAALITQVIRQQSRSIWDLLQAGGHVYVCGGAQTFGAAVKRELIDLLVQHGGHDEDSATAYLQDLARRGRLCEDLAG